jgi:putative endonuclease
VGRKFESYLGSQNEEDFSSFFVSTPRAMMFYIYILYSESADRYYVGLTSDVGRRLKEHNYPEVFNKYTSKHIPWELKLFFECSDSRGEGLIVERFIKNQKSRVFLERLIFEKENPEYFTGMIENILKK